MTQGPFLGCVLTGTKIMQFEVRGQLLNDRVNLVTILACHSDVIHKHRHENAKPISVEDI
jgi:hypothetical protein